MGTNFSRFQIFHGCRISRYEKVLATGMCRNQRVYAMSRPVVFAPNFSTLNAR